MIDHELVTSSMNAKQVLVNLSGSHPIKEILTKLMSNPESAFNPSIKESLDGPSENYCQVIRNINEQLLVRDPNHLAQDRIAIDMLLNEKLRNIARPDRKNCIELNILRNQGITTVRQLVATNSPMANHFSLRILHYKYSSLMDASLNVQNHDTLTEAYIPIGKGYKRSDKVSSRELRVQSAGYTEAVSHKLPLPREQIIDLLPKVNKLRCVKTKSFALRLLHEDVYTGTTLLKFGLTDTDRCPRCRHSEDLMHILKDCWYAKIIWTKLHKLYFTTDHRRQTYVNNDLAFVTAASLSKAKLKLHLEIIRRLCNKDRPSILPSSLISQSLDYLIICDREHHNYYRRIRNSLNT